MVTTLAGRAAVQGATRHAWPPSAHRRVVRIDAPVSSGHIKDMENADLSGLEAPSDECLTAVRNRETVRVNERRAPIAGSRVRFPGSSPAL